MRTTAEAPKDISETHIGSKKISFWIHRRKDPMHVVRRRPVPAVPSGATTGFVTVTTSRGTLKQQHHIPRDSSDHVLLTNAVILKFDFEVPGIYFSRNTASNVLSTSWASFVHPSFPYM